MERYFSKGQSPQRAVAQTEEELERVWNKESWPNFNFFNNLMEGTSKTLKTSSQNLWPPSTKSRPSAYEEGLITL